MARILDTVTVSSSGVMPSLGDLIGSRVSSEVFDRINSQGHVSFFGEEFDHMRQDFINRHVRPLDTLNLEISRTVNLVMNPDTFRILDTIQDFRSIPSCMEIPILLYEPVRKLAEEGRVEGFGWDITSLPEEDAFGRLINNFTCEDVREASDADGYYDIEGTMYDDDPDLTDDELYSIRKTREYILNKVLNETDRDPTAIDLSRG